MRCSSPSPNDEQWRKEEGSTRITDGGNFGWKAEVTEITLSRYSQEEGDQVSEAARHKLT